MGAVQPWDKSKKPWYKKITRWILIILAIYLIIMAVMFIFEVKKYKKAYETGDFTALNSEIIDMRQLIPSAPEVSRLELETYDDPSYGSSNPQVVIVEFIDFGCPFTKQNVAAVNQIKQEYKDTVRFIMRDFPVLTLHPEAAVAAQAANCANDQGLFWPYHDLLYARQGTYSTSQDFVTFAQELGLDDKQFVDCLESKKYAEEVQQDLADGLKFGVPGTPTFFINGKKYAGVISYDKFKQIIDQELSQ